MKRMLVAIAVVLLLTAGMCFAANYVAIHKTGSDHYNVRPMTLQDYDNSTPSDTLGFWCFPTQKEVSEFARAGVFGTYETYDAAKSAIQAVDPQSEPMIRKPSVHKGDDIK
jgi:hypothetical protein